jgi:hypothetical protein
MSCASFDFGRVCRYQVDDTPLISASSFATIMFGAADRDEALFSIASDPISVSKLKH